MRLPDGPGSIGLTSPYPPPRLVCFQTAEEGPGWIHREILPPAAAGWAGTQTLWPGGASLSGKHHHQYPKLRALIKLLLCARPVLCP